MSFAQHIQEIRRRYRPGDPLAVHAFMRRCGIPLQRVVRRALRSEAAGSRLVERIQQVVARMNGAEFETNRSSVSISLICQRLCATLLWGDSGSNPHRTEMFAETWFDKPARAHG